MKTLDRRSGAGELRSSLEAALGAPVEAIAVMGKWEPTMRAEDCLREVRSRAAAALALSLALSPQSGGPGPTLLCAEGHLRKMPRPGCVMAAEILVELGARPEQIWCWSSSNCTFDELQNLDKMRRRIGAGGLVLVTSGYHVLRTRHLQRRLFGGGGSMIVMGCSSAPVRAALAALPEEPGARLEERILRGERHGLALLKSVSSETMAFLASFIPNLERFAATVFRGDARSMDHEMFQPDGHSKEGPRWGRRPSGSARSF